MGYNFGQLKNQLKFRLGNRNDLDSWYGTWINMAYANLTSRDKFYDVSFPKSFKFPKLEVTESLPTASDKNYIDLTALTTKCLIIYEVRDTTNDVQLEGIGFTRFRGLTPSSSGSKPTQYSCWGDYLYLYDTPNGIYNLQIDFRKRPTAMQDNNDTPALHDEMQEALLDMATITGFRWLLEYEKADIEIKLLIEFFQSHLGIYDQEKFGKRDNRFFKIHQQY